MSLKYKKYLIGDEEPIKLNIPQILTVMAPQPNITLEWGRGCGKSTIFADRIQRLVHQMPRGSHVLVGETYSQILTRTLPSTIEGLAKLGYHQNLHYFIGRTAPAKWKWDLPYQPPLNWDHAMHWYTGACYNFVSLDLANSGRGLNSDSAVGDEAALFDEEKLFKNVTTTIRGNVDRFKHVPLHQSTMFCSSTPLTAKGRWLLQLEQKAKEDPKNYFYLRASSEFNRHNLGDKFFERERGKLSPLLYNAEILNIRPEKVEGGFYPKFDENTHTYNDFDNVYLGSLGYNYDKAKSAGCAADNDLQKDKPIDIAFDYGGKINTLVAEQTFMNESRILNAMFVKSPVLLDQLIIDFCKYYHSHKEKHVIYWYDQTAVGKYGVSPHSFADVVMSTFRKNGWKVTPRYVGAAPSHHDKYMFFASAHSGTDPRIPPLKYNRTNCKYLIISIQQAGVREGNGGFEKDKRPERTKGIIDEETTHFSDAHDTLVYFKYSPKYRRKVGDVDLP